MIRLLKGTRTLQQRLHLFLLLKTSGQTFSVSLILEQPCEPLIEEMKKEFPELESLSDIYVSDITKLIVDDVTITEHEESVVDVEGIKAKGWWINWNDEQQGW